MTNDAMHLLNVVQESDDGDFIKAIAEMVLQWIMITSRRLYGVELLGFGVERQKQF